MLISSGQCGNKFILLWYYPYLVYQAKLSNSDEKCSANCASTIELQTSFKMLPESPFDNYSYRQWEHLWWIVSQCSISDDALFVRIYPFSAYLQCLSLINIENETVSSGVQCLVSTHSNFHPSGRGVFLVSQNSKS